MKRIVIALLLVTCIKTVWAGGAINPEWEMTLQESDSSDVEIVCLYRDKASAGLFSKGNWKAELGPYLKEECVEMLDAKLEQRTLFLHFVSRNWQRGNYDANKADVYCNSNYAQNAYGCYSEFFVDVDGFAFRAISPERVDSIIKESGLIALLEKRRTKRQREKEEAKQAVYLEAYKQATTLELIHKFEVTYAGNDTDELIIKLAEKKSQLEQQKYRDRFASAKTAKDFLLFIADYDGRDIDGLVPEARLRLAEIERNEAAERDAVLKQAEANRLQTELNKLERQIVWCKNQSSMAQKAINRENEIGSVSGYVNTDRLHQAGEIIVYCKDSISKSYAEYKQRGGVRPLAALK